MTREERIEFVKTAGIYYGAARVFNGEALRGRTYDDLSDEELERLRQRIEENIKRNAKV